MMQACVGIVSRRGLELLCPEYPETIRFLWRRARRRGSGVICFWSVLPQEIVADVESAIHAGRTREALDLVQLHAVDGGTLLPEDDRPPPLSATHDTPGPRFFPRYPL